MKITSRIRRLFATSLVFVGLAAGPLHAQTPSVAIVNGTTCTSAHAVSVTYTGGALNIQTGGCGTAIVLPPPTLPPTITNVSVPSGARGAAVTINGTNLAGAMVTIGGAAALVTNNTGQQLNTTVPSNAIIGAGFIVATTTVAPAASFAFTVTSAAASPVITLISPTSGSAGTIVTITGTGLSGASVTIGGAAATVTTGSATSITTTVPANATIAAGSVAVTTTGGTTSSPFTVNPPPVGGADVSVEGVTLSNPSKYAFIAGGIHIGANGGGSEVNAYAMPGTANCNTTPTLTKSWQHNIDLQNYRSQNALEYFVMQSGESLSYKFVAPMVDASGGFAYNDAPVGAFRPTFMTVTPDRCNFDKTKLDTLLFNGCFKTATSVNNVSWTTLDPSIAIPAAYCRLVKGQTYYFNLRFQDARSEANSGTPNADSCVSGNCGGVLQFQ